MSASSSSDDTSSSNANEIVKNFLSSVLESETLTCGSTIITVSSTDTAEHALRVLVDNRILSAPVVDTTQQDKVVGLISMRELTNVVLEVLETRPASPRARSPNRFSTGFNVDVFMGGNSGSSGGHMGGAGASLGVSDPSVMQAHNKALATEFSRVTAAHASDISQTKNLRLLPRGSTLLDAAKVLSEGHVHRVLITDEHNKLVNVVTQSALMKILAKHIDMLGPLGEATVDSLKLGRHKVICVQDTEITSTAFRQMLEGNVTAMAVVSSIHHKLVANLSFTDLKGIDKGLKITALWLPVHQFLVERIRSQMVDIKAPTISCSPTTNLKTIILRMCAANIHRIYVVDQFHHPIGIITMTDVLRVLSA